MKSHAAAGTRKDEILRCNMLEVEVHLHISQRHIREHPCFKLASERVSSYSGDTVLPGYSNFFWILYCALGDPGYTTSPVVQPVQRVVCWLSISFIRSELCTA